MIHERKEQIQRKRVRAAEIKNRPQFRIQESAVYQMLEDIKKLRETRFVLIT